MVSPEAQTESVRINIRRQWTVGWMACAIASLMALGTIASDWNHRSPLGKFAAVSLLVLLLAFPTSVVIRLKRGNSVSAAWIFTLAYVLLMLAVQAFGPLTRVP